MSQEELLERIKELEVSTIENMSPDSLAMLTNGFKEPFVKAVIRIGTWNHEQRKLIDAIEKGYENYMKDDPFWATSPQFPEYMRYIKLNIECNYLLTKKGWEKEQRLTLKISPVTSFVQPYESALRNYNATANNEKTVEEKTDKKQVKEAPVEKSSLVNELTDSETIKKRMDDETATVNSNTHNQTSHEGKNEIVHEITWEERKQCFRSAVLHVMEVKMDDEYLFNNGPKWIAPYRFAVDNNDIMYDKEDPRKPKDYSGEQYEQFDKLATELNLHDSSLIRVPFKRSCINQITKPTYARFNNPFPWPSDGIKNSDTLSLSVNMREIYKELELAYKNNIEALKTQS